MKGWPIFNAFFLTILQIAFLLIYFDIIVVRDWNYLYVPMLLTVFFSIGLIATDKRILPFGANVMVFVYSVFSLLALLLLLPVFPEIENVRSAVSMSFLRYEELSKSICIACIGIITFVHATWIFSNKVGNGSERVKIIGNGIEDIEKRNTSTADLIADYSIFLLALCLLYFLFFIATHLSYLAVGYTDRTASTANNSLLSHATVVMALSVAMLFTVADSKKLKIGIVLFGMISIVQFAMGNRGEVYYPILACIAAYTKRKGTFKKKTLVGGIVGSLLLISFVRVMRNQGAMSGNIMQILADISPLESIAEALGEMGFQIGTVAYMLRYLNLGGHLQFGKTLVYSFQTFLCKYIPFMPSPDITSPAAIKTIMPTNYFAFTNIGEAYYNFGLIGVYLFCILLAAYLVNTSKFCKNIFDEIFANMFLVELILWVRNSSATMPVYLAWTIVLLVGAKCVVGTAKRGEYSNENNVSDTI